MPAAPLLSLARHDRRTTCSIRLTRDFIFAEFHPAGKRDEIQDSPDDDDDDGASLVIFFPALDVHGTSETRIPHFALSDLYLWA